MEAEKSYNRWSVSWRKGDTGSMGQSKSKGFKTREADSITQSKHPGKALVSKTQRTWASEVKKQAKKDTYTLEERERERNVHICFSSAFYSI
jgi:hypothetical protein